VAPPPPANVAHPGGALVRRLFGAALAILGAGVAYTIWPSPPVATHWVVGAPTTPTQPVSTAGCPTGELLVSGGFLASAPKAPEPDQSQPLAGPTQGWQVATPTPGVATALCTRAGGSGSPR